MNIMLCEKKNKLFILRTRTYSRSWQRVCVVKSVCLSTPPPSHPHFHTLKLLLLFTQRMHLFNFEMFEIVYACCLWLPLQSNKYGLSFNSLVRKNMQSVAQHFKVQAEEMWNGNINKAREEDDDDEVDIEMHCGAKKKVKNKTHRLTNTNTNKHMLQSSKSMCFLVDFVGCSVCVRSAHPIRSTNRTLCAKLFL